MPPCSRAIVPWSASQSRAAASTSACKTVFKSNVERLMTLSTSAVRVWRLHRSRTPGEEGGVFDRDHRLGREILHQLDLLVAERPHLLPIHIDGANNLPFFEHRDSHQSPCAGDIHELNNAGVFREIGLIGPQIGAMDD